MIQNVAEVLLYPRLAYWHYEQIPVVTGILKIDTLRVYKHRTGGGCTHRCADEHTNFAILVSANSTESTRCSKLYIGRSCLDFRRDEVQHLLIFKKMRCLDYSSSLVKGSENDVLRHLNPEGGPDRWGWKTEDLELSPSVHKGRHELYLFGIVDGRILTIATLGLTMENLMFALTGWILPFNEVASSVVVKGRKIKGALVMVWERANESGKDVHLLVRASNDRKESESTTWLSTSREWHPRLEFQQWWQGFPLRVSPPAYAVRV